MDLKNKTVTVIGLGNSGMNAVSLLCGLGARVRGTDAKDSARLRDSIKGLEKRGAAFELGRHTEEFIKESDLVVLSPGVEDSSPALRWALKHKIPVVSELELGYRFCKGRIIAITGTNGKSTVTTLIGEILKKGGKDTVVCGNIGNSLCGEIPRIKKDTWVVIEVSSFQLERIEKFRPQIAAILNVTDDHLDRYKAFGDYFNEKMKIFANQDKGDFLILNHDAANLRPLKDKARSRVLWYSKSEKMNGAYVKSGAIVYAVPGKEEEACKAAEIPLKGVHNLENVLASALVASLAGVSGRSMSGTIRGFKGLPHRCEPVATIGGVDYIDDSKGTTVDSTYRALESFERPVILIAGGKDKKSDYRAIRDLVGEKVKRLILIGEAKEKIRSQLGGAVDVSEAGSMEDAVEAARKSARPGDIVLLSPMCSSFDMFRDYKHRGDAFREAVMAVRETAGRG
ncbi:MAG: UDP-N-acetylmuramoyl-L-alanine--D-glutamate ligase [Candidatus Omnitrophica bacterium]|nr:UDP-N-acetylmuramoyl-L-alanine--D-glutamate ligase [Candidatus Omnitrophota bacterium]